VAEVLGEYLIVDPGFRRLIARNMRLVQLWTGAAWTEGPTYFADLDVLLFSDIPNDRIMRFVPDHTGLLGSVSVYRHPAGHTNGHTRDREGRLVSCEHSGRRVTRTEPDGRLTVIADRFEGKRLNSPNDVVVKSDGTIWFTDPPYGILSDLEGVRAEPEYGGAFVFRADPRTGDLRVVADDFVMPNGLAFSPDERILYIADSGASHRPDGPRHIRAFHVDDRNRLAGGDVLAVCDAGRFDGLRLDTGGRLWAAANDGVHCLAPSGELLGKVLVPEVVSNVSFGGPKRNRLFITATTSLYAVYTHVNGAQRP
jgi:gluconolactonase